jgi:hypothetical protein
VLTPKIQEKFVLALSSSAVSYHVSFCGQLFQSGSMVFRKAARDARYAERKARKK